MATNPLLSIVVTAHDPDLWLLNRVSYQLDAQTGRNFEVVCVVKTSMAFWSPFPNTVYTAPNLTYGDREKVIGLRLATGRSVCWISADNEVWPGFVAEHAKAPDGHVSIVNIEYEGRGQSHRRFPLALEFSKVDLLNFALPREAALQVRAFEGCHRDHSDWDTLERVLRICPPTWDQHGPIVGRHN